MSIDDIKEIYLGEEPIKEIYLGDLLIYKYEEDGE